MLLLCVCNSFKFLWNICWLSVPISYLGFWSREQQHALLCRKCYTSNLLWFIVFLFKIFFFFLLHKHITEHITHTHTHARMHTHTHTHTHTHIHTHIHTQHTLSHHHPPHTCIHTHTHTHMRTNTHMLFLEVYRDWNSNRHRLIHASIHTDAY